MLDDEIDGDREADLDEIWWRRQEEIDLEIYGDRDAFTLEIDPYVELGLSRDD